MERRSHVMERRTHVIERNVIKIIIFYISASNDGATEIFLIAICFQSQEI